MRFGFWSQRDPTAVDAAEQVRQALFQTLGNLFDIHQGHIPYISFRRRCSTSGVTRIESYQRVLYLVAASDRELGTGFSRMAPYQIIALVRTFVTPIPQQSVSEHQVQFFRGARNSGGIPGHTYCQLFGSSLAERIWIPEGEKDVDSLCDLGLTSTTSGGANDPWLPAFDRYVAGRDVVILVDNDGPGWNRVNILAEKLRLVATSVRIVSFAGTDLPEHGDVSDWLEAGHTREELEALAHATPAVESHGDSGAATVQTNDLPQSKLAVLSIADMSDEVLDGRLGEICQRRMVRFPNAYGWPALVTVAGTLVERPNSGPLRTNLFCGLVGPVDSGKSQAIECAIRALGLEKPRLQNVMSGSAEGLLAKLSDAEGAARLVSPDELGHLLSKPHRERKFSFRA